MLYHGAKISQEITDMMKTVTNKKICHLKSEVTAKCQYTRILRDIIRICILISIIMKI